MVTHKHLSLNSNVDLLGNDIQKLIHFRIYSIVRSHFHGANELVYEHLKPLGNDDLVVQLDLMDCLVEVVELDELVELGR